MTTADRVDHEEGLVRAFIVRAKQERLIELLGKPKRRKDVLRTLPHFKDLDERFVFRVPPEQQSSAGILELLRGRGAPTECHVLSETRKLDGRTMALSAALDAVVGRGMGTLISCIPGRLGYFEGEAPGIRYVLERGAA